MPGLSDSAETAWLRLLFQNIAWAGIGDAPGLQPSAVAGVFWLALHTADPTDAGVQTSSETAYTNYARISVARSVAGFTVVGDLVSNAALVVFQTCGVTAGPALTHFSIGTAQTGAGVIVGVGPAPLAIAQDMRPQFEIGDLTAQAA